MATTMKAPPKAEASTDLRRQYAEAARALARASAILGIGGVAVEVSPPASDLEVLRAAEERERLVRVRRDLAVKIAEADLAEAAAARERRARLIEQGATVVREQLPGIIATLRKAQTQAESLAREIDRIDAAIGEQRFGPAVLAALRPGGLLDHWADEMARMFKVDDPT